MTGRDAVLARLGVSRETAHRLDAYVETLSRWSGSLNLVSRSTLAEAWVRHVEDSAQIWPLAPRTARHWLDLGSGAGLPGLIVAALAKDVEPDLVVTLVESDERKAAFLGAAAMAMGVTSRVINARIESADVPPADVISARALAPLPKLLGLAHPHLRDGGVCLFHKGASVASELTAAASHWHSRTVAHRSVTDPTAVILEIQELSSASAPER